MFEVDKMSSLITKLSKYNMGASDAPHVIFFQEQKLSSQSNA